MTDTEEKEESAEREETEALKKIKEHILKKRREQEKLKQKKGTAGAIRNASWITKYKTKDSSYTDRDLEAKKALVHIDGRKDFYKLRKYWSVVLSGFIFLLILFQFTVIMFVGSGVLDLIEYKSLLVVTMGETFLQIIGMGYIVVNFLFNGEADD